MEGKTKDSQNKIVRKLLESGRVITSWEMISEHRITRLASRISELKKMGLNIETELVKNGRTRYAKYKLS